MKLNQFIQSGFIWSLWILVCVYSCNSSSSSSNKSIVVENNDLVFKPFNFNLTSNLLLENNGSLRLKSKTLTLDKHYSYILDTILVIESKIDGQDYFKFYKSQEKEFIINAKIKTDRTSLKHGIKVGMSKQEFSKVLPNTECCDTIKLIDTEQTISMLFYFSDSTLDSVIYNGYLD